MDERDIIMLEALIQTQNLTHAAERLFTTQPALTKRLRRLESLLCKGGCPMWWPPSFFVFVLFIFFFLFRFLLLFQNIIYICCKDN